MDKNIFTQLELLTKRWQVNHLKKIYPDLSGVKMGAGFLWQHPGHKRQKILEDYRQKLQAFGL